MRLNYLRTLLFVFLVTFSCATSLECTSYDCSYHLTQNASFETAHPDDREFLVNLAIESNDIYHTRTASIDVAREVFSISDAVFEKGIVEVLKVDGEIVGFYTLKVHDPSDDWFRHELGHLFVKAGLQGQGLGTLLFRRAVTVAGGMGWVKLEWLSDPDAEEFYLKMGAKITGHCENLLNPGVNLPIFEYLL